MSGLCKTMVFIVVCYIFIFFVVLFPAEDSRPFLSSRYPLLKHVDRTNHGRIITYDDNYMSLDVVVVELKQFDNLKRLRPESFVNQYNASSLEDYKHNVVIHCGDFVKGIVIIIDELYREIHTSGGSSFRILSTSSVQR